MTDVEHDVVGCVMQDRVLSITESLAELNDRIAAVDKKASISEQILLRQEENQTKLAEVMQNLSSVMQKFEITIVKMQTSIDTNISRTENVERKFDSFERKFEESESKSKFDIRDILKKNYIWFFGGGGIIFVIVNFDKIKTFISLFTK